jgi:hypothetical protein
MEQVRGGPMADRTVLVTGASGGIGRATALGLAAMGAHLAITGRDRGRTQDAAREIRAAGGVQVDVFVADLSSQSQLRRLAGEVLQSLSRIDVLVNNAGGFWNTRHVTADGLERTFALNHLAPFLLTSLLLDLFRSRGPRPRPAAVHPVRAALHEGPGPGRRHVHPPGFRSRSGAGDGPLLRQQQTQEILQAQLRPGRRGTALADQRRSDRPDRSRGRDQPGEREGRLKPPASYPAGGVRVLGEDQPHTKFVRGNLAAAAPATSVALRHASVPAT